MKKILITGASGFVGIHLTTYLLKNKNYQIFGTHFGGSENINKLLKKNHLIPLNLLKSTDTKNVIQKIKPDWIIHLAALSSASDSFKNPQQTLTNNTVAQLNLLDALVGLKLKPKILVIGSAEEYGIVKKSESPVKETNPLRPLSPYAVSKITQDYLGLQYYMTYKIPIIRLRPFNHVGEGQRPQFVLPAFSKQIAEIEAGIKDYMMVVGDLSPIRDFTDVQDICIAYELALKHCQPGEVYNIGTGRPTPVKQLLNILLSLTTTKVKIKKDPSKFRPADVKILVADASKFKKTTGWKPTIALEETVKRVLNYWREQIKK